MLFLLLIALALLLCAMVGWVNRQAQPLVGTLHPARQALTPTDIAHAHDALGAFEAVAFRSADGLTLRGWYKPSRNGAVVIFVHGGSANRAWFLPEAKELVARQMGVLLYDSRACGESDGDLQSWGDHEQNDLLAAIDFVAKRPDVNPQRIGVDGFSMGATTAALVTARDTRVHAVVLNALWSSLQDEINYKAGFPKPLTAWWVQRQFAQSGVRLDQVRPREQIARMTPRELLIIEGDQDRDTPMAVAQADYAAANGPKQFWVVPGADHVTFFSKGGPAYVQRVGDFFSKAL